jgi:hypothetical protein
MLMPVDTGALNLQYFPSERLLKAFFTQRPSSSSQALPAYSGSAQTEKIVLTRIWQDII